MAVLATVLAACQAPQGNIHRNNAKGPVDTDTIATSATATSGPTTAGQPEATPQAESQPAPPPTDLPAMPAVARDMGSIAPVVRLTGDPKELIGLDHAVVRRALGDPVQIRMERPAQVWQYATGDCIVDLYLYNLDGSLTVAYVEARSHTAQTEPTARCLKSLLERPTASAQ